MQSNDKKHKKYLHQNFKLKPKCSLIRAKYLCEEK